MFCSKEFSREQHIKHSTEGCSEAANDARNVLFSTNSCVSVYNRLLTLITVCQFGPDSLALDVTCVFNKTEIFCIFVQLHLCLHGKHMVCETLADKERFHPIIRFDKDKRVSLFLHVFDGDDQ